MRRLFIYLTMTVLLLTGCKKDDVVGGIDSIVFTGAPTGEVTMTVGTSMMLVYAIYPVEAMKTAKLEWSSSNEDVVSVMQGMVISRQVGTAIVTARCGEVSASVTVHVVAVPVTSFTLANEITLAIQEETPIPVGDIQPSSATAASIEWSIIPTGIAEIFTSKDTGSIMLRGLKVGTATLTGRGEGCEHSCVVDVVSTEVSKITIICDQSTIYHEKEFTLTATVKPDIAKDTNLTWSFSKPSAVDVVSISEDTHTIRLMPKTADNFTVTATASNGVTGTYEVSVRPVTVTLKADNTEIKQGSSTTIRAVVEPESAQATTTLTWKSRDGLVSITPSSNTLSATVTGLTPGNDRITVTGRYISSYIDITIAEPKITSLRATLPVEGISPNGSYGFTSKTAQISVEGYNEDIKDWISLNDYSKLTFQSSNATAVSVDNKGKVTALGHGVHTIYISGYNGVECSMKVRTYKKEDAEPIVTTYEVDYYEEFSYEDYMHFIKWRKLVPNTESKVNYYDMGAVWYNKEKNVYKIDQVFAETVKYNAVPVKTGYFNYWTTEKPSGSWIDHELSSSAYPSTSAGIDLDIYVIDAYYTDRKFTKTLTYRLAGMIISNTNMTMIRKFAINDAGDTTVPEENSTSYSGLDGYAFLTLSLTDARTLKNYRKLPSAIAWSSKENYKDNDYFGTNLTGIISRYTLRYYAGVLTISCSKHPNRVLYIETY